MNNLKFLIKNEVDLKFDEDYIKKICDSAYKEDKKRIDKAILYLAKR